MSEEVLVSCENVSKIFCRDLKKSLWYGVQDIAGDVLGSGRSENLKDSRGVKLRRHEFWANKDINFELRRGECLGVIGKNGSGKTTLLKMLNGLIKPDTGRIRLRGEMGSLIALGAGFNPILTGRENIYNNAAVLGMDRKQIRRRFDEIVAFAEIESAIDAPVKTYSSGMKVRLGFAVATSINPDILILDEVLAVGDESFRYKCYNRLSEMHKDAAVILVSHSMGFIRRLCDRVLYCEAGEAVLYEDVNAGVRHYSEQNRRDVELISDELKHYPVRNVVTSLDKHTVEYGREVVLTIRLDLECAIDKANVGVTVNDNVMNAVAHLNTSRWGELFQLDAGEVLIEVPVGPLYLNAGIYNLTVRVNDNNNLRPVVQFTNMHSFELVSDSLLEVAMPMILPDRGFGITNI